MTEISKLNFRIVKTGDGWEEIFLSGPIDEQSLDILTKLEEQAGPKVILNLQNIGNINSLGLRTWTGFARSFGEKREWRISRCSPDFTIKMAMVPQITGKALIISFHFPLYCPQCDCDKSILLSASDGQEAIAEQISSRKCEKCESPLKPEYEIENIISRIVRKSA
ncbi:MAG: hypothetical protein HQK54_13740 [Oligoflexales bacterium]|nr:hypothetical protein [Oligoflexales bacterium]